MTKNQCKYSNERLTQMAREQGLTTLIHEIDPSAIADTQTKRLWKRIWDTYSELEESLNP